MTARRALDDLLGAYDKLVMDPVHGGIPLFRHEVQAIDHSLLQRLRSICQNDILSLVFPGATHSRFLHSIGTMHVGSRMFRSMIDAYLKEKQLSRKVEMTFHQVEAIDYFLKIIRLACLFHDSGHSSFSHQFTQAERIHVLMAVPGRFAALWDGIDTQRWYPNTPDTLEHEHYSIRVAYEVLRGIDLESYGLMIDDVLGIMETTQVRPSDQFIVHAARFWEFITGEPPKSGETPVFQLIQGMLAAIVSGEIDADRCDYMLRDGFHASVMIGGFNLDHLLSNLRFGWDLDEPWMGLAITRKGLGALEDFVYSRHQMYRQVYAHKTALGFDWLLREAINEVLEDAENLAWVDQCLSDMNAFRHLTDSFFWEAFRRHARRHPLSYSRCIVDRLRLRHIETQQDLSVDEIEARRSRYAQALGCDVENVVTCVMNARFSKIRENFRNIRVLNKEPITGKRHLKQIDECSDFFRKFGDGRIIHFYRKPSVLMAT